jgi:hypothetical protein
VSDVKNSKGHKKAVHKRLNVNAPPNKIEMCLSSVLKKKHFKSTIKSDFSSTKLIKDIKD